MWKAKKGKLTLVHKYSRINHESTLLFCRIHGFLFMKFVYILISHPFFLQFSFRMNVSLFVQKSLKYTNASTYNYNLGLERDIAR